MKQCRANRHISDNLQCSLGQVLGMTCAQAVPEPECRSPGEPNDGSLDYSGPRLCA
jgi:hypothetical protein